MLSTARNFLREGGYLFLTVRSSFIFARLYQLTVHLVDQVAPFTMRGQLTISGFRSLE